MTPAVTVELSPVDVSSPFVAALVETCSIGVHSAARCVLAGDATTGARSAVFAIVTWDGPTHNVVRIEVGLEQRGTARWASRILSFSARDPEVERWRTAGFAIATLVGEAVALHDRELVREDPYMEASRPGESGPANDREFPVHSWLDARFAMNRGATGFAPAQGGELSLSWLIDDNRWFLTGGLQCTVQRVTPYDVSVVQAGAYVGAGVLLLQPGRRGQVAFRLATFGHLVEVSGTDSATGITDRGGGFLFGFTQGIDGSWLLFRNFGVVLGGELIEATGPTEITAHALVVARIPELNFAAEAGLRLTFR